MGIWQKMKDDWKRPMLKSDMIWAVGYFVAFLPLVYAFFISTYSYMHIPIAICTIFTVVGFTIAAFAVKTAQEGK